METKIVWRKACWQGDYPHILVLTSEPILMLIDNQIVRGEYHVNGCFYSSEGYCLCSHSKYGHDKITYWQYVDQVETSTD